MANFPASATSYSDASQVCVLIRREGSYLLLWCNRLVHVSEITATGMKTTSSCCLELVYFRPPPPMPAQIASVGLQKGDNAEGLREPLMKGISNWKYTAAICKKTGVFFCSFSQPSLTKLEKYANQPPGTKSALCPLILFSSCFTNINTHALTVVLMQSNR